MGSKKSQVVGWRYYFGIHMGIGKGPVDALREIKVGDRTAWAGDVSSNTTINIDAYNLFGGEEKEGGVQGPLQVMMGEADQVASSGLRAMLGDNIPGFRRMFTVFYNGLVSMNNPYPKPWKFRLSRILKGWDGPVWQPALAPVPIVGASYSFPTSILDIPYTVDAYQNLGPGVLTDGFFYNPPTNPAAFNENGMLLTNDPAFTELDGFRQAIQELDFTYSNNFSAFDEIVYEAELLDYSFDSPGGAVSGYGFTASRVLFFYTDIFSNEVSGGFYVRYLYYEGVAQFVMGITGAGGGLILLIPLGNPTTMRVRAVASVVNNSIRYYVNGVLTHVQTTIPPGFRCNRVEIEDFGTFTNFASTGLVLRGRIRNVRLYGQIVQGVSGMNPAHIIYECLTNREWGRGLSRAKLDEDSFLDAATTLFDEGFGLCLKWTRKDSIANFIQSVLDHIGATLYQSRITGLMTLKLIRADYDIDELPVLTTENGLLEIRDVSVAGPGKSVNAVTVTWHDPLTDEDRTVSVKNPAAVLQNGGAINSVTKNYKGVASASLALRLAQRDLRAVSTNLRKFSLVCDQTLDVVHPGDVLVIEDAKRGISRMAVRVGKVRDGTLLDGKVTLDVIQDVFGLPATSFAVNVPSTYTPPDTKPCYDEQRAFEVPYFLLASRLRPADLAYVAEDGGYLAVIASKGKAINQGVQFAVRESAPTPDDQALDDSYVCGI